MKYDSFIESKSQFTADCGFDVEDLPSCMFDFQQHLVRWALQLDAIARAMEMWSNPGEIVLTPFLGVGSEVFGAVSLGRRGIGVELKPSYFRQAVRNLARLGEVIEAPKVAELPLQWDGE